MSVIHKFKGTDNKFDWENVPIGPYPNDGSKNVTKQELIGSSDAAYNFAIRYFEVAPGGYTTLDNHQHDHGVLVVRGKGKVLLGEEKHDIGYGDVIYVSPNETHQFENGYDEPLGFICVIPPKK